MGRVTRGRGGRYREGRSFDEERGSPTTKMSVYTVLSIYNIGASQISSSAPKLTGPSFFIFVVNFSIFTQKSN